MSLTGRVTLCCAFVCVVSKRMSERVSVSRLSLFVADVLLRVERMSSELGQQTSERQREGIQQ